LKDRGVRGVKLVISDDHAGLGAARRAVLGSVSWQPYQFHLQQNAGAYVPRRSMRKKVAADIRAMFMEISEEWQVGKRYCAGKPFDC
jgi:putative transposase